MLSDASDGRIEIHILNAGVACGESIVIRLPHGGYGVVDCYARSLRNENTNPTVEFLQRRNVDTIEFLCLTHPHSDHYRGMSQILRKFRVLHFWRFGGLSAGELRWLAGYKRLDAEQSRCRGAISDAQEFQDILSLARKLRKGPGGLRVTLVQSKQQLYPCPVDASAACQIWALAPCGNSISDYQERLNSCFSSNRVLLKTLPHRFHNTVSVALLVRFGQTCVILGGDVEKAGWGHVAEEFNADALAAHVVKVSHHGSVNGYTEHLWEHFSSGRRTVAVVTPYHSRGLPQREALEHIGKHVDSILTTFTPTEPRSVSASRGPYPSPLESRIALRQLLQARTATGDRPFGRCTLVYDGFGGCLDVELKGVAAKVLR
jgi:beta-lactamase superfamily II metal-dependent hydrolase